MTRSCRRIKYVVGSNADRFTNAKLLYRQYKTDGTKQRKITKNKKHIIN